MFKSREVNAIEMMSRYRVDQLMGIRSFRRKLVGRGAIVASSILIVKYHSSRERGLG